MACLWAGPDSEGCTIGIGSSAIARPTALPAYPLLENKEKAHSHPDAVTSFVPGFPYSFGKQ